MKQFYGRYSPTVLVHGVLWLCIAFIITAVPTSAQTGPPTKLFVGHLNTDCYPDTVRGHATNARTYLPDMIVWGKPSETHPVSCDKDSTHGGHPQGAHIFPVTPIIYPNWPELHGSVAFEQYNTNDNITDIILYLWGKSPLTGKDTSKAIVLYGQLALDTLPAIIVGNMHEAVQTTPYFAIDLKVGREFIEPAVRDISGQISYELPRTNFLVKEDKPVKTVAPTKPGMTATVTAYPNPAELWTRLESSPLEEGEYVITVMAVNGRIYHTQTVQVSQKGQIDKELNLNDLPSGYYAVRLQRDGQLISSHSIVIVR